MFKKLFHDNKRVLSNFLPKLYVLITYSCISLQTVYANGLNGDGGNTTADSGETIWTAISAFMYSIYSEVLGLFTLAAVVAASIILILMFFSKNGKVVDESRNWLKTIVVAWIILNSLSFIIAYIVPFFDAGVWQM